MNKNPDSDELRGILKRVGVNKVAAECGITASTLYDFTSGKTRNMRTDTQKIVIAALEKILEEESDLPAPLAAGDFQAVPIYDIRASAGAGALVEDGEPTAYQPYREAEIARYNIESLAVIQVGGDSMWETLHDGDKVLVDRSVKRIVRPGIYILGYEGELIVKRCQRNLETGAVIVQSDNPDYETFTVTDADRLDVLGRVVWIGRSIG